MNGREHLAQTERRIAECRAKIARQRVLIGRAISRDHDPQWAVDMLRALEGSLRVLDRHRQLILDDLEDAEQRSTQKTGS